MGSPTALIFFLWNYNQLKITRAACEWLLFLSEVGPSDWPVPNTSAHVNETSFREPEKISWSITRASTYLKDAEKNKENSANSVT